MPPNNQMSISDDRFVINNYLLPSIFVVLTIILLSASILICVCCGKKKNRSCDQQYSEPEPSTIESSTPISVKTEMDEEKLTPPLPPIDVAVEAEIKSVKTANAFSEALSSESVSPIVERDVKKKKVVKAIKPKSIVVKKIRSSASKSKSIVVKNRSAPISSPPRAKLVESRFVESSSKSKNGPADRWSQLKKADIRAPRPILPSTAVDILQIDDDDIKSWTIPSKTDSTTVSPTPPNSSHTASMSNSKKTKRPSDSQRIYFSNRFSPEVLE